MTQESEMISMWIDWRNCCDFFHTSDWCAEGKDGLLQKVTKSIEKYLSICKEYC